MGGTGLSPPGRGRRGEGLAAGGGRAWSQTRSPGCPARRPASPRLTPARSRASSQALVARASVGGVRVAKRDFPLMNSVSGNPQTYHPPSLQPASALTRRQLRACLGLNPDPRQSPSALLKLPRLQHERV